MHHLTCGISSLLHSVNLILFTVLLVHLILLISPNHSHHLRSHHLSLPLPSTPDLKLISFTNPFLHSHSYSFRTDFTDLNLYWIKGALFCFSFCMATCARLSCILSFRVHVKLYTIVSYRISNSYPVNRHSLYILRLIVHRHRINMKIRENTLKHIVATKQVACVN